VTEQVPEVQEPVVTPETRGFWDGIAEGELRVARCASCGTCTLREQSCLTCGASERAWVAATGRGSVKTFVIFHRGYQTYWATQVPYNVAVITLEDGPELLTNVVGVAPEDIVVGAPVRIEIIDRGSHRAPVAVPAG
jgi:uncharacterized OB-fold protein